ncbi:uncharacterized protein LOC121478658 isoform X2 [Vulpes lagopus]|uniref:uncharacterized protein LOC121478658 isoform X2 n=1 Tax=Vulpes lagopus TaxID=494514 RepID=UPI001BC9D796|nr:uncharacterized protein LOC121478658 isoform X2 [Vulpes lagopus]
MRRPSFSCAVSELPLEAPGPHLRAWISADVRGLLSDQSRRRCRHRFSPFPCLSLAVAQGPIWPSDCLEKMGEFHFSVVSRPGPRAGISSNLSGRPPVQRPRTPALHMPSLPQLERTLCFRGCVRLIFL